MGSGDRRRFRLRSPDVPLSSDRLLLRGWEPGDAAALAAAWRDAAIIRWSGPPPTNGGDEQQRAERWIAGCDERLAAGVALDLVVVERASANVVGEVGLSEIDPDRPAAMLGYWIAADARGRGIAAEAVGLLAGWALGEGGFGLLAARCHPANAASLSVLLRCGFEAGPDAPNGDRLFRLPA